MFRGCGRTGRLHREEPSTRDPLPPPVGLVSAGELRWPLWVVTFLQHLGSFICVLHSGKFVACEGEEGRQAGDGAVLSDAGVAGSSGWEISCFPVKSGTFLLSARSGGSTLPQRRLGSSSQRCEDSDSQNATGHHSCLLSFTNGETET